MNANRRFIPEGSVLAVQLLKTQRAVAAYFE